MAIGRTFEESLQKAIRQVDPRWTGFEAYWQPEDSDRLHRRADVALDVLELGQVPLGDLGDEVVERRLRQVDPRWTGFEAYWQPEDLHNALTVPTDRRLFASKVRPMAMTSPTDFIDEPMSRWTCWNLAKSHLGILVYPPGRPALDRFRGLLAAGGPPQCAHGADRPSSV
jgi:hypothetical protein